MVGADPTVGRDAGGRIAPPDGKDVAYIPSMPAQTRSVLFTQCLQNDFVAPLGPWDAMPSVLHIGSAEASRLMGDDPDDGPVARFLAWAHGVERDRLEIVHVRDLHRLGDPEQAEHLAHFGPHCLEGSAGAEFVFRLPGDASRCHLVSSTTLNDFLRTDMERVLSAILPGTTRAGIVGAWTDAKVSFLAYELRTRHPHLDIAVCSALAASSSRERHLTALDHLERVIGVRVFHSMGEFCQFLAPKDGPASDLERHASYLDAVRIECDGTLAPTDRELLAWLFRDASRVQAHSLDGGFSGNAVLAVESFDVEGRRQCPHVVKIGPRKAIGQERISFETIEPILGNSAPRIADFSDLGERGGIKYRYASMTSDKSRTFQKLWREGLDSRGVETVLRTVFQEQLGRLYQAASPEPVDLLELWGFDPKWADGVERAVRALGNPDPSRAWEMLPGLACAPVAPFYRHTLANAGSGVRELAPMARVHGDLNGANILIDGNSNVWLIDFFHSRRHHVACDFVKLENDLLHVWTPMERMTDLVPFGAMLQRLMEVEDLASELPSAGEAGIHPRLERTWETLRVLRSILSGVLGVFRDPWQQRIAALRYAVHTLSFDEPDPIQKRGALLHAGLLAGKCREHLEQDRSLRVDWVPLEGVSGRVGLTILPGRRDRGRNLTEDLDRLSGLGVDLVVGLVATEELSRYGVDDLPAELSRRGIGWVHSPILDQHACGLDQARMLVDTVLEACRAGRSVVVHCLGGIGRSGMVAACVEVAAGMGSQEAIAHVRRHRSPRALETRSQVELVEAFERSLRRGAVEGCLKG